MADAVAIILTAEERAALERLFAAGDRRAKIVLLAANLGLRNDEIARSLDLHVQTVGDWRRAFAEKRLGAFTSDDPRRSELRREDREAIVRQTIEQPPVGRSAWSIRSLADASPYSPASIWRAWDEYGIDPAAAAAQPMSVNYFGYNGGSPQVYVNYLSYDGGRPPNG